jgi:hypothetical protein
MANILLALQALNGASFIGIDTNTEVKLKGGKKNPMLGRVRKHVMGAQAMVFQNKMSNGYENMIKRRLEKEGWSPDNFTLSERPWGKRLPGLPIVEHKGEYYLEVIYMNPGMVSYTLNGVDIAKQDIEGLEDKKDDPNSQGGLEDKVILRVIKLSSIEALRIDGQVFQDLFYEEF